MGHSGLDAVQVAALGKAAEPIVLPVPTGAVKVMPRWAEEDEVSKWRLKYCLHDGDFDPNSNDDGRWTELELRHFTRELPLSGLEFGQLHYFKVAIETPDGWSDWSPAVKCEPPSPSPPGKCAAVYAIVKGGETVLLRWTKPLDYAVVSPAMRILGYQILVTWTPRGGEDPSSCSRAIDVKEDVDSWEVDGLESLTDYYFQVAAENIAGWGEYSDHSPVVNVVPPVPKQLNQPTLRRATHHSVVIQWQHPAPTDVPVESFRFRFTSSSDWSHDVVEIQEVGSTLSQYVIESLRPGQVYIFQVRALNRFGMSIWSESSIPIRTLVGGTPSKITDLRAPHVYSSFIRLMWHPVEENGYALTSHVLRFAHTPDMAGAVEVVPAVIREKDDDTCDIRHLRKKRYFFQVAAINKMGMAEWSDAVEVDMTPAPPSLEDAAAPPALKDAAR
eukprot:gb/GFBE01068635.1/.p1 GENE.gb/GFBE01068635.1/~~gb/GFBE01068635.1/.p1  ORF type:complete len:444 (+),score=96.36 gb/GFBE01068635.1/:1-1332(+)